MDKNYFTPHESSPPQDVRGIMSDLLNSGMPEIPHQIGIVEALEQLRQQPWFASLGENYVDEIDHAVRGVVSYWEEEWLYKFGWPRVRAVLERQGIRTPGPKVPPADVRGMLRQLLMAVLRQYFPEYLKDMDDSWRPQPSVNEALQALQAHARYAATDVDFVDALSADFREAGEFWGEQALVDRIWPKVEALLRSGAQVAPLAAVPAAAETAGGSRWRRFRAWLLGPE